MKMRHESLAPRFNAKFVRKCYKKENEIGRGGGTIAILNGVVFSPSAYKILLQTEEDRLTVVVNQGLLTLSDVRLNVVF